MILIIAGLVLLIGAVWLIAAIATARWMDREIIRLENPLSIYDLERERWT